MYIVLIEVKSTMWIRNFPRYTWYWCKSNTGERTMDGFRYLRELFTDEFHWHTLVVFWRRFNRCQHFQIFRYFFWTCPNISTMRPAEKLFCMKLLNSYSVWGKLFKVLPNNNSLTFCVTHVGKNKILAQKSRFQKLPSHCLGSIQIVEIHCDNRQ